MGDWEVDTDTSFFMEDGDSQQPVPPQPQQQPQEQPQQPFGNAAQTTKSSQPQQPPSQQFFSLPTPPPQQQQPAGFQQTFQQPAGYPAPPQQQQQYNPYQQQQQPQQQQQQQQQNGPSSSSRLVFDSPGGGVPGGEKAADPNLDKLIGSIQESPFAQLAGTVAGSVAQDGKSYIDRYSSVSYDQLRYFFEVDTKYVGRKLLLLLFPFLNSSWHRQSQSDKGEISHLPPRGDLMAPDLYIPCMAFLTYVLIVGFAMGTKGEFDPEILGMTSSSGLVGLCIEVILLKLGLQLLPEASKTYTPTILELTALSAYTFLGLFMNILVGIFFDKTFYYAMWGYTSLCMAWVVVRSLKSYLSVDSQSSFSAKGKIMYFLMSAAALQFLVSFFLGVCP